MFGRSAQQPRKFFGGCVCHPEALAARYIFRHNAVLACEGCDDRASVVAGHVGVRVFTRRAVECVDGLGHRKAWKMEALLLGRGAYMDMRGKNRTPELKTIKFTFIFF
jgi:hypothetical protein